MQSHKTGMSRLGSILLICGVLLIAANLRGPFTGVAPILDEVSDFFGLSSQQAGLLTTLPLLAFALVSPFAAYLAVRLGLEWSLFFAILFIILGFLARLFDQVSMLYLGTIVIGIGIAIGNVLLPSVVKRSFPTQVAILTSSYVLVMSAVSGGFSSIVNPLSHYHEIGWQWALASFVMITFLTLIVWLPQLRHSQKVTVRRTKKGGSIWRSLLAWQVTIYLGMNSFFSYIIIAWLPSILHYYGFGETKAGVMHGVMQFVSAIPGIVLVPLLSRLKDQRIPAVMLSIFVLVGSLGLLFFPQFAIVWVLVLGFCSGACFILGLSFISLRTSNLHQAALLSGMSQSVGYSLAAIAPMLAGYFYQIHHNWAGALWLCAGAGLICAISGFFCGRDMVIKTNES